MPVVVTGASGNVGTSVLAGLIGEESVREIVGVSRRVVGTRRVLDAVLGTGVPTLVHASSVGTYTRGPEDRPVDEAWPATSRPGSSGVSASPCRPRSNV